MWLTTKLSSNYLKNNNNELIDAIFEHFLFRKMEFQYNRNYTVKKALQIVGLIL